jgi:ribonucleotide monophosphatase NagD (HAD superfamily)
MGWISILVKTGIFKGPENCSKYPANYVVNNLEEAINLILKLEGMNN